MAADLIFNHAAGQEQPLAVVADPRRGGAGRLRRDRCCSGGSPRTRSSEKDVLGRRLADSEINRRQFTSDLLINLARRNQSLLHRQLEHHQPARGVRARPRRAGRPVRARPPRHPGPAQRGEPARARRRAAPAHLERARAAARRAARGHRRDREPRARRVRRRRAERRRRAHRHRPHAPAGRAHRERRALLAAGHHRHGARPARPGPPRRAAAHASRTGASACPPSELARGQRAARRAARHRPGGVAAAGLPRGRPARARGTASRWRSASPRVRAPRRSSPLPPSLFAPLYPAAAASAPAARPAADPGRRGPQRPPTTPRRPRPGPASSTAPPRALDPADWQGWWDPAVALGDARVQPDPGSRERSRAGHRRARRRTATAAVRGYDRGSPGHGRRPTATATGQRPRRNRATATGPIQRARPGSAGHAGDRRSGPTARRRRRPTRGIAADSGDGPDPAGRAAGQHNDLPCHGILGPNAGRAAPRPHRRRPARPRRSPASPRRRRPAAPDGRRARTPPVRPGRPGQRPAPPRAPVAPLRPAPHTGAPEPAAPVFDRPSTERRRDALSRYQASRRPHRHGWATYRPGDPQPRPPPTEPTDDRQPRLAARRFRPRDAGRHARPRRLRRRPAPRHLPRHDRSARRPALRGRVRPGQPGQRRGAAARAPPRSRRPSWRWRAATSSSRRSTNGAALAVHADRNCDMGMIGYEMTMLANRAGHALTPGRALGHRTVNGAGRPWPGTAHTCDGRVVPVYAVTGGRTRSTERDLPIESIVTATDRPPAPTTWSRSTAPSSRWPSGRSRWSRSARHSACPSAWPGCWSATSPPPATSPCTARRPPRTATRTPEILTRLLEGLRAR